MKRRAFFGSVAAVAAGAAVVGLVGCGERPQVIEYKQGKYQGKPYAEPWKAVERQPAGLERRDRHPRAGPERVQADQVAVPEEAC